MADISRLGLGCMGMNYTNQDRSIRTIHAALDKGITLYNTGDFYGNGASEIILGEALRGVPRDKYFVSVKFGMLSSLKGGLYGIDVNPWHIKAYLAYSLQRLHLDYIDLYEPARLDETIPVEDVIAELIKLKDEGYIGNIGVSMVKPDTLRKANAVHPIHTAEMQYSLVNRAIEDGLLQTAEELGVGVLAFGTIGHGLLSDSTLDGTGRKIPEENFRLVQNLKAIADEKGTTISKLSLAWALAKSSNISTLIGTTSEEHLQEAIDALALELTAEDVRRIEEAFPKDAAVGTTGLNTMRFHDGVIIR